MKIIILILTLFYFNFVSSFLATFVGSSWIFPFREGSRFFIRYNTKVDIVPYTAIMAYASGFRVNWDIKPLPFVVKVPIKNRVFSQQSSYRALHSSIEGTLDRYGLDGRACLIRAFCELHQIQHHNDLISRILKILFKLEEGVTCPEDIDCPISLVAFGYLLYNQFRDQNEENKIY